MQNDTNNYSQSDSWLTARNSRLIFDSQLATRRLVELPLTTQIQIQIHTYFEIFRHIQAYSGITRHIQAYSKKLSGSLAYSEPSYIQNQMHIQSPGIFRTLAHSEHWAYWEPYQRYSYDGVFNVLYFMK